MARQSDPPAVVPTLPSPRKRRQWRPLQNLQPMSPSALPAKRKTSHAQLSNSFLSTHLPSAFLNGQLDSLGNHGNARLKKMVACMRELAGAQTNYLDSVAKIAAQADVDIFLGSQLDHCALTPKRKKRRVQTKRRPTKIHCAPTRSRRSGECRRNEEADENQIGDGENAGNFECSRSSHVRGTDSAHNLLEVSLQQRHIFEQMEQKVLAPLEAFRKEEKRQREVIVDRYSGHRIALEKANANLKGKARQWQRCCDKACSALSSRNRKSAGARRKPGKNCTRRPVMRSKLSSCPATPTRRNAKLLLRHAETFARYRIASSIVFRKESRREWTRCADP